MAIGVDADQYGTYPEVKDTLVSSAMKNVDAAVYQYLQSIQNGGVKAGVSLATLKNGGVGLAPFHSWESKIPADVKNKIKEASDALIAGKLKTGYQP
jgi:basic membrane protein A